MAETADKNEPCRRAASGLSQTRLYRTLVTAGLPLIVLAGSVFLFIYDPVRGPSLLPCVFYQLTGLNCIGCGATRAVHALLHGDLLSAVSYNLFFITWLPVIGWSLLAEWLRVVAGRLVLPHIRGYRWLLIVLLASALTFLVLRNLPWAPFNWLAA